MLAKNMFKRMIEDSSDKVIHEAHDALSEFKRNYFATFQSINDIVFVNDLFEMLEEEWDYRQRKFDELAYHQQEFHKNDQVLNKD